MPGPDGTIRAIVIGPVDGGRRPGVLLYTDIFQLTESTLRTARRLASSGFVVCVPEIYPRGELAGVALEFDDAGKQAGLAGAAATTTAQFDADRVAVLDFLAAARRRRRDSAPWASASAATWRSGRRSTRGWPRRCASTRRGCRTGSSARSDAGSLARAADIAGRLMVVFGSRDPHVPADARRADPVRAVRGRADRPGAARLRRRRARVHAGRRGPPRPGAHRPRAGRRRVVPRRPLTRRGARQGRGAVQARGARALSWPGSIESGRDVAQLGSALDWGSRGRGSNPVVPTARRAVFSSEVHRPFMSELGEGVPAGDLERQL